MGVQTTFKRYEVKYLLNAAQKEAILKAMAPHMRLDRYGRTTICNIYYDTDNFRLARHSIEKPAYKEKLRVRSYGPAASGDTVFVELKKKYDGIVYKRRLTMTSRQAEMWLSGGASVKPGQISREVEYFRDFYGTLKPAAYLTYEREAYFTDADSTFRVTFDENIMARTERMGLDQPVGGRHLIPEDMTLMEIKCAGGFPLWMVRVLSEQRVYKTSFSKYGTAYQGMIAPDLRIMPQRQPARGTRPVPVRPKVSYSRAV